MSSAIDLAAKTHADKDALIFSLLPLIGQLEAALTRVAILEARTEELTHPPRTPDNSSMPPARGRKPNRPSGDRPVRGGCPGVAHALAKSPDHLVEARLDACPACWAGFPAEVQTPQGVCDRIELPPVRPHVTRVHLFGALVHGGGRAA